MISTWWDELYANWMDPDPHWQRDWPFMRDWVTVRYDVANRIRPRTIVEIGVRAGYSAFAFLSAAPEARYIGIDTYAYPGYSDSTTHAHARRLLSRWQDVQIMLANSQYLGTLPIHAPDLVHVDGEHSTLGCLHDCELALISGAHWILVDDVIGIDIVREGAAQFLELHNLTYEEVDSGQQGAWLINLKP